MRNLAIIPILHTQEDLGALAEAARQATIARQGLGAWEEKQRLVTDFWARISEYCRTLPADLSSYRLYQDGLPVCNKEGQIVAELAGKGSLNHRLLAELMDRGAKLMGTESAELLLEEYRLAKNVLGGRAPLRETPGQILERRDRFIALRISQTLRPEEHGLLFIGLLHRVEPHLPADIQITHPTRK